MSTILVLESGSRSGYRFTQDLTHLGHRVVPLDTNPYAMTAVHPEFSPILPGDHPSFLDELQQEIYSHSPDAFTPTVSVGAAQVSELMLKNDLSGLPLPVHYWYDDKLQYAKLEGHGLRVPSYMRGCDVPNLPGQNRPMVLKPRQGKGSTGVRFLPFDEAFVALCNQKDAAAFLLQDRVFGTQFTVDILNSEDQIRCWARKVSAWDRGSDSVVELCTPETRAIESRVWAWVSEQPFRGLFNVEVILDAQGQLWLIDLNLRVSAGYRFTNYLLLQSGDVSLAAAWHRLMVEKDESVIGELESSDFLRTPLRAYDTPDGVYVV